MTTWPLDRYLDHEGYVTAASVRALIADACPEMARALRAMVITVTEPDPDDLTSEELEAWIQSQFDDVVDDATETVADAMPGNSHPTFFELRDQTDRSGTESTS